MKSFFRLSLCKPVELNSDGTVEVDYDWRDHTYTIVENLEHIDLNKQYMCFVVSYCEGIYPYKDIQFCYIEMMETT